ncbi:MAG: EAL domain-containing protein [Idiomarina sp.]|nr:EAL domain-containing protein [Idiomarina sp.]
MAGISFRARLLLLLSGLVAVSLGIVIFAILWATNTSVQSNIDRELGVSERVFLQLLELRETQLTQSAAVLADDFGFRQAVASADENTILSALVNHGQRMEADLITLLSPTGEVIVSTHEIDEPDALLRLGQGRSDADFGMIVVEGEIYQLVAVPVRAPHLIALVLLGFVVDNQLASELQQLTNTQISFVASMSGEGMLVVTSSESLTKAGLYEAVLAEPELTRWLKETELRGKWIDLLAGSYDQLSPNAQLRVLLSASVPEASAPFTPLRKQLVVVSLFTLIATILVALITGRQVVEPVRMLADAAKRIARGRYDTHVEYGSKDELGQLATSFNQMQVAISGREQRISHQSDHDLLTDLPNRRYLGRFVGDLFEKGEPFGLLILNLDNFKQLNDMFGQTICDQLLIVLAKRLQELASLDLWPARLHGDEFVMVLRGNEQRTVQSIPQILSITNTPLRLDGLSYNIHLSAGIAHYPHSGEDLDTLLRRAQFARIQARGERKDFGVYQAGEDEPHMRKLAVSAALADAVADNGLSVVYQPQISLEKQAVSGVEALIRWQHPQLGFISPVEFIPLAEQSGEISLITHWILARTIEQLAEWRRKDFDIALSVNLSAADLVDSDLAEHIFALLEHHQVPFEALTVEVTESAVMQDPVVAVQLLEALRVRGIGVAIDDYGTGYSSLSQLRKLPADELKIDRAFVMELDTNKDDQTIVSSTIDLAHRLGLKVVAEGVETAEVWHELAVHQCDVLQGYYISKPMTAVDLESWLSTFEYSKFSPEPKSSGTET